MCHRRGDISFATKEVLRHAAGQTIEDDVRLERSGECPLETPSCVQDCISEALALHDLAEETGEHVRLDWKRRTTEQHARRTCSRCTTCCEGEVDHDVFVPFFEGKHINLLELESLISFLERITSEGIRARRLLVVVDSRVVLGAVSKGRSSSREINFLLRKLGFWCLAHDIALELVWVPTWANPADAPSRSKPIEGWYASLSKLPPPPTAVFASAHALSELDLLREPLSAAALTAGEHVHNLESSGAFSCSEMEPAYVENETLTGDQRW